MPTDWSHEGLPTELSHKDRIDLFYQSYLPVNSWSGTPYENCTLFDISAYTEFGPNLTPYMSKARSTKQLTDFLSDQWPSREVSQALCRLDKARWAPDWGPETIIKSLPDIDVAFFGGWLRGLIQFSWQDPYTMQSLKTANPEFAGLSGDTCMDPTDNICHIRLNRDMTLNISADPRKDMFVTAFHELCHAYENVTCGIMPQDLYDAGKGWTDHHGWMFRWLMNVLDERTSRTLGFNVIGEWEDYRLPDMARSRLDFPFERLLGTASIIGRRFGCAVFNSLANEIY